MILKTYSKSRIELQNLQTLKKMLEKSSQFLSSQQPCEPKSLDVALNIAGVEKHKDGKLANAVNTGGHLIRVLNGRSIIDGGNLYPVSEFLKSVWYSVEDTL